MLALTFSGHFRRHLQRQRCLIVDAVHAAVRRIGLVVVRLVAEVAVDLFQLVLCRARGSKTEEKREREGESEPDRRWREPRGLRARVARRVLGTASVSLASFDLLGRGIPVPGRGGPNRCAGSSSIPRIDGGSRGSLQVLVPVRFPRYCVVLSFLRQFISRSPRSPGFSPLFFPPSEASVDLGLQKELEFPVDLPSWWVPLRR